MLRRHETAAMLPGGHRVRIAGKPGEGVRVWIDDNEVRQAVGVQVEAGVDNVVKVSLSVYPEQIEVDATAPLLMLEAPKGE